MTYTPITPDEVHERLGFARRRMDELLVLNGGDLPGSDVSERQQLVQEFFFHLVGAVEVLAQLVNERRGLGLTVEDASVRRVASVLPQGDALRVALEALYANTRPGSPVPPGPYSDEGLVYRIWNYRHQVTHRRRNPFRFNITLHSTIGTGPPSPSPSLLNRLRHLFRRSSALPAGNSSPPTAHFILDPRDPNSDASSRTVQEEMEQMLDLIGRQCSRALQLVP